MNHDKVLLSASWWWWWLHEKTFRSAKIDNTKKRRTATSLKTNLIERERETGTSLSFLGLTGRQKCQEREEHNWLQNAFSLILKILSCSLCSWETEKWVLPSFSLKKNLNEQGEDMNVLPFHRPFSCSVCFSEYTLCVLCILHVLCPWRSDWHFVCVYFSSVSIDSKSDRKRRKDVKIHTIVFSCKEKRIDWRQERHVLSNLLFSLTVKRREFFLSNPSLILSVTREASFRLTTKLLLIY